MFPAVPKAEQVLGMTDHLNRWLAAGNTLLCHLYKNNFSPDQNATLADFTEVLIADMPGYAPITVTPSGTPYIDVLDNCVQIFSDPVFQPSADPPVPLTVYGYYITIHPVAGPDTLLYGKRLDTPPVLTSATDAIALDPDISQAAFTSPETE